MKPREILFIIFLALLFCIIVFADIDFSKEKIHIITLNRFSIKELKDTTYNFKNDSLKINDTIININ